MYLTKSDFKIARTCPTKLYYKKRRYPTTKDDNPYLEFLADGGFMVERMAKLLHPEGVEIGDWEQPARAFEEAMRRLTQGNCTLFEATLIAGTLMARVDILRRVGNELHLIEVKSISIDGIGDGSPFRGARGGIDSKRLPYLEDVTFQTIVLERAMPGFRIIPYLFVVDKSSTATENTVFERFPLEKYEYENGRTKTIVGYTGDVDRLRDEHVLARIDVSDEVSELHDEIEQAADAFAATFRNGDLDRIATEIGTNCKKCEYRIDVADGGPSGFHECWGALADVEPHILDLYRIDLVGGRQTDAVTELSRDGKASLLDVDTGVLTGKTSIRQIMQITHTRENQEYIDPVLPGLLVSHSYPLHFIDFEASPVALSYHEGMHPYGLATFQWSVHTITAPVAPLKHAEWLNVEPAFPNFAFARALKDCIGEDGTVYIWSKYERSSLTAIRRQMDENHLDEPELAGWLDRMTDRNNPRLVDLCEYAKEYYFHPVMKGRLSIKYVLPAVWTANPALHLLPEFAKYYAVDTNGSLMNPYDTLPALPFGEEDDDEEVAVREGTGAIRIYQDMLFGRSRGDTAAKDKYCRLLLQYCELDTAAMVMIWKHWAGL